MGCFDCIWIRIRIRRMPTMRPPPPHRPPHPSPQTHNHKTDTALHVARLRGYTDCAQLLEETERGYWLYQARKLYDDKACLAALPRCVRARVCVWSLDVA